MSFLLVVLIIKFFWIFNFILEYVVCFSWLCRLYRSLVKEICYSLVEVLRPNWGIFFIFLLFIRQTGGTSLFLKVNLVCLINNMNSEENILRKLCCASYGIGFIFYFYTFQYSFEKFNIVADVIYAVLCLAVSPFIYLAYTHELKADLWLKAFLMFVGVQLTAAYTFFDKKFEGHPDWQSLVSKASFAVTSLCLSKLSYSDVEADLLKLNSILITLESVKLKWYFCFLGGFFSFVLIMLHSYLPDPHRNQQGDNGRIELQNLLIVSGENGSNDVQHHSTTIAPNPQDGDQSVLLIQIQNDVVESSTGQENVGARPEPHDPPNGQENAGALPEVHDPPNSSIGSQEEDHRSNTREKHVSGNDKLEVFLNRLRIMIKRHDDDVAEDDLSDILNKVEELCNTRIKPQNDPFTCSLTPQQEADFQEDNHDLSLSFDPSKYFRQRHRLGKEKMEESSNISTQKSC